MHTFQALKYTTLVALLIATQTTAQFEEADLPFMDMEPELNEMALNEEESNLGEIEALNTPWTNLFGIDQFEISNELTEEPNLEDSLETLFGNENHEEGLSSFNLLAGDLLNVPWMPTLNKEDLSEDEELSTIGEENEMPFMSGLNTPDFAGVMDSFMNADELILDEVASPLEASDDLEEIPELLNVPWIALSNMKAVPNEDTLQAPWIFSDVMALAEEEGGFTEEELMELSEDLSQISFYDGQENYPTLSEEYLTNSEEEFGEVEKLNTPWEALADMAEEVEDSNQSPDVPLFGLFNPSALFANQETLSDSQQITSEILGDDTSSVLQQLYEDQATIMQMMSFASSMGGNNMDQSELESEVTLKRINILRGLALAKFNEDLSIQYNYEISSTCDKNCALNAISTIDKSDNPSDVLKIRVLEQCGCYLQGQEKEQSSEIMTTFDDYQIDKVTEMTIQESHKLQAGNENCDVSCGQQCLSVSNVPYTYANQCLSAVCNCNINLYYNPQQYCSKTCASHCMYLQEDEKVATCVSQCGCQSEDTAALMEAQALFVESSAASSGLVETTSTAQLAIVQAVLIAIFGIIALGLAVFMFRRVKRMSQKGQLVKPRELRKSRKEKMIEASEIVDTFEIEATYERVV